MSETQTSKAAVARAMCKAMRKIGAIEKDGRNDYHRYDYISAERVTAELRVVLAECGLALVYETTDHDVIETKDNRGKIQYVARVHVRITLIEAETGESVTSSFVGEGVDAGDKAYNKAYTGAMKQFLFKTFLISSAEAHVDAEGAGDPLEGRHVTKGPPDLNETHALLVNSGVGDEQAAEIIDAWMSRTAGKGKDAKAAALALHRKVAGMEPKARVLWVAQTLEEVA